MLLSVVVSMAAFLAIEPANVLVVDGDTVMVAGDRVRLLDIDTPEIYSPSCKAELQLGLKAKARLQTLVHSAHEIAIHYADQDDRYGRKLGSLYLDGEDVAGTLLAEGLALRWYPGRKAWLARKTVWCGDE